MWISLCAGCTEDGAGTETQRHRDTEGQEGHPRPRREQRGRTTRTPLEMAAPFCPTMKPGGSLGKTEMRYHLPPWLVAHVHLCTHGRGCFSCDYGNVRWGSAVYVAVFSFLRRKQTQADTFLLARTSVILDPLKAREESWGTAGYSGWNRNADTDKKERSGSNLVQFGFQSVSKRDLIPEMA